jgi:hypothetical protein
MNELVGRRSEEQHEKKRKPPSRMIVTMMMAVIFAVMTGNPVSKREIIIKKVVEMKHRRSLVHPKYNG